MRLPKIWINVSASNKWNRPAVGILRVEQSLADNLEKLLGGVLGKCIWYEDKFIDLVDYKKITALMPVESIHVPIEQNALASEGRSNLTAQNNFDSALTLFRLFRKKPNKRQMILNDNVSPDADLQKQATRPKHDLQSKTCLRRDDVLITVGLDWDYPYTNEFFKLKKKHGIKIISCSYDLIPVLFPQYCVGDVAKWFSEYLIQLTWGSSAVLCISKQTQNDYLTFCKQAALPTPRTKVITLGDNVPSSVGEISSDVSTIADKPFILFVSSIERRKNHETLYKAYNLLIEMGHHEKLPKLVFVGMHGWGVADLMKDIELNPLTNGHIIRMNHVNDAELNLLYKKALFCLYPSLYEGWGLPIGEALAMGKLVIASDKGSIPEVGGSFVHYLEAWNPYAWADAIIDYIEHPEKIHSREKLVLAEYEARKWSDTALTVKELALELLSDTTRHWEFMPGYDLSTQCGQQLGGKVFTQNMAGFLCHGPYVPFRQGKYIIDFIFSKILKHDSVLIFEIASSRGDVIHMKSILNTMNIIGNKYTFHFELLNDTFDVEFRVHCDESCDVEIEKIKICQASIKTGKV